MIIIGRENEKAVLEQALESHRPELVVVYGRRRVGKTYLIKEYFNNLFSFYATGVSKGKMRTQLLAFQTSLKEYWKSAPQPMKVENWFDAFSLLRQFLESKEVYRDPLSGKRVVFLDEVPWFSTARSDFESALDFFWNSYVSSKEDMVLILCGSATSWIIDHFLSDRKGFYNRVTRRIQVKPFTLMECKKLALSSGLPFSDDEILEGYLTFGGIPYYWNLMNPRFSMEQNIQNLIFEDYGPLSHEFDELFASLFRKSEQHFLTVQYLFSKRGGLTRNELLKKKGIVQGKTLTVVLRELEQCGFIRKYIGSDGLQKNDRYQIVDEFLWFSSLVKEKHVTSYLSFSKTPDYYTYRGYAFEILCLNHIQEIKKDLGIGDVETKEYPWQNKEAQIDLVIDRADNTINLCEMKCVDGPYEITKNYESLLRERAQLFSTATKTGKSLRITMVTFNGVKRNQHSGVIQNEIVVRKWLE